MKQKTLLLIILTFSSSALAQKQAPEKPIQDLITPAVQNCAPAAGKRVRMVIDEYKETNVHHALYLPTDWEKGKTYPMIVEYAGNKYKTSPGTVDGSNLGYGISGGKGCIWLCLPYVSEDHQHNEVTWWGDLQATVDYCKTAVADTCQHYGGDPNAVFIAGFSRGAIACNYIGLYDDEIAALWKGFICFSHYDGVRQWHYAQSDRSAAAVRLERLKGRPQFICQEKSIAQMQEYLKKVCPNGNFTFVPITGWEHNDNWVLFDIPERTAVRKWLRTVLKKNGSTSKPSENYL